MILPKSIKVKIINDSTYFYSSIKNFEGIYNLMPKKYNNLSLYLMSKNGLNYIIYQGSRYFGDDIIIRKDQNDEDIFWILDCSRFDKPEFGSIPDFVSWEANKCLPTDLEFSDYMGRKIDCFKIKAIP